jgi:hypothetical protein
METELKDAIAENVRAHANEYDGEFGQALRNLAVTIEQGSTPSDTVAELFGPKSYCMRREDLLADLWEELNLPKAE